MPVIALADLAIVAVALVLMLAIFMMRKAIVAFVPDIHIPLVGSLRDKVNGALGAAFHALQSTADAALGAIPSALHATIKFFAWFGRGIGSTFSSVYDTARWVVETYIPREVNAVRAWTDRELVKAAKTVKHDLGVAEHYAVAEVDKLAKKVAADVTRVERYAVAHVDSLAKTVAADLTKAESYAVSEALKAETAAKSVAAAALATATSALNTAITDVSAALAAAESTLTADYTAIKAEVDAITGTSIPAVIASIDGTIEGAAEGAWGDITAAAGALGATIDTDFADVRRWLETISASAIGDLAGVTTLAIAATGIITSLAEDCIVPQCRNLGGLGNLLKDLTALLGDGALLALLVEMASDPEGAASDVESILGPIANSAASDIRGLLNV